MKKVVILRATGGELTNQLWNYASVYAYCLSRNYSLENPCFFEYGNSFTMPQLNIFFKFFFFLPFTNYTKRKQSFKRRFWRKAYGYYAKVRMSLHRESLLISDNLENKAFYLPPTRENKELSRIERSAGTLYLDGWLFRNPVGLRQYRKEILDYFKPRHDIERKIKARIETLRNKFKHVVGVHVRQGDYKTWRGGAYFIPQERVRGILDEYLRITQYHVSQTCFVITSDGPVDIHMFEGLQVSVNKEGPVYDLFLLSSTDTILGSNSTFGAFASYYGNIPFFVMQKEPLDWDYYSDKKTYFENKYSTFVSY